LLRGESSVFGKTEDENPEKAAKNIIFKTVPFASNARNEMERQLGYDKKSYFPF
jgi:hypothetical protein